jgi:hypothetical protein
MEYLATTAGDAIPSGAAVVVTDVVGSDAVQVEIAVKNDALAPTGQALQQKSI